jgi:hypothetical protein
MTDLRSTRRQGTVIWDAAQKQWFKDQCLYAKNNNLTIAWVNSVSFGGNQTDNWGGFTSERTEISNFFRDNSIQHMFILSGDAHMLAIDNGANHDFSTGSNNPFDYPVFATAPLNQSSGSKGGNYNVKPDGTVDPAPGANYIYLTANNTEGQYGLVEITDNGVQLCIKFTGYRVNSGGTETQLTTYTFCRIAEAPLPIKLTSFTVKTIEQRKVQLDWEVSDQTDCQKYVVEYSEDGINFNTIATVDCHPSNKYSIIQNAGVKQQNFYRLKMMEVDGKFSYSPIRTIGFDSKTGLEISPNPVKNVISFSLRHNNSFSKSNYLIFDMNGKKVAEGTVTINGSSKTIIAIEKLGRGNYLLQLSIQGSRINQQFVVQ